MHKYVVTTKDMFSRNCPSPKCNP